MKQPLPNEIINHIMSFRTKNPVFLLFHDSFLYNLRDNSNNSHNSYLHDYCYDISFYQWYLCIYKKRKNIHIPLLQKI
jgi:hypothetical protein